MDMKSAVDALKLFNEKANKLEELSFTKKIFGHKSGFRISGKEGQFLEAQRFGPDEESIDAFVLTLRFFIQDNEAISFRKMADLYATLPVNPDLIQKFNDARDKTNKFLDSPTPVKIGSTVITYRYVLEVFLWGGLAHANQKKKLVYDKWLTDPILLPVLQNEFVLVLATILNAIFFIRAVNKAVLAQICKSSAKMAQF